MEIDLMTLSIVVSGVSLIATLTLYSLRHVMPRHPSIQLWLGSGVLGTLSFGAVLTATLFGNMAFAIHHALSLISLYLLYKGSLYVKGGRPHDFRVMDGVIFVYAVGTAWLFKDQLASRYIAYDTVATILLVATFYRMWRHSKKGRYPEYMISLMSYGVGAVAFAYHLYLAISGGFSGGVWHPYNEVLLVIITFIISAWTYGNMLVIHRQVQREIENEVRIDDLTGLLNRKGLHEALQRRMTAQLAFRLYVIDLNDFKSVNDTYGHLAGDRMLQAYARRLRKTFIQQAHLARVGGDEFIVATHGTHDQEIPLHCEELVNGETIHLRASVGEADFPEEAQTLEALLQIADVRMYHHKVSNKKDKEA